MSLTKEEFDKLEKAMIDIDSVLGEMTLSSIIALMAGVKAMGAETHAELYKKLEEIEAGDD